MYSNVQALFHNSRDRPRKAINNPVILFKKWSFCHEKSKITVGIPLQSINYDRNGKEPCQITAAGPAGWLKTLLTYMVY
jgi:hypothetical protein